jgi:hypothetical protein
MKRLLILLGLLLIVSLGAFGQYSYTSTSISATSTSVYASAYSEIDYYTAYSSYVELWGALFNCNCSSYSQMMNGSWSYGASSASYSVSATASPNSYYSVWALPYLVLYYDVYVDSNIEYEDPYGYSLLGGDIGTPSIFEQPPGQYVQTFTEVIPLDAAYVTVLSPALQPLVPTIYSISPAQGLIGDSITVTISGTGFDPSDVIISDSGVYATLQYADYNEIIATFVIDGNDPGGSTNIYVLAQGQGSNGGAFYKQVPSNSSVLSARALQVGTRYGLDGCEPGQFGIQLDVVYQVLDQRGLPIRSTSMIPVEQDLNYVMNGTWEGNPRPEWGPVMGGTSQITAGRLYTDPQGTFEDAPFGTCSSSPFVATYTQPLGIQMLGRNNPYPIRTNHMTEQSTAPQTGWSHNDSYDVNVSVP